MVNAVEQEAADKIAQKELELTKLREKMPLYGVGSDENESLVSYEPKYESLRQELDAISKHLSNHEVGQLSPHASLDFDEELRSSKRIDHLHRKVSGNLVSTSTSIRQGNGKHEDSLITIPENVDTAQLKHLSREELVSYFKNEMAKMKRNHDIKVQEMIEEYYSVKREFLKLKESGPSLPLKKDRDFDILRKKIPEVLFKLDDNLVPNEKIPAFGNNADGLDCLRDRLESLLLKNRQVRDLLADKEGEVNHLSPQVSDAVEKSQQSLTEADLLKRIENLKCAVEEASLQASVNKDVYKERAREKLGDLNMKERALKLENEKLKQDILILETSLDGKEKLLQETAGDLEKEKNQFELVSRELRELRYHINQQQILISKCNEESDFMKGDLLEALEQIERVKVQLFELNQKFEQTMEELRESNDEKGRLLAIIQNALSLVETGERENRKQMEPVITLLHGLSKAISDLGCRITGDLKNFEYRLMGGPKPA
ncbi:hypothetical protein SLE2022_339000 [Rubroshorea leprosula]